MCQVFVLIWDTFFKEFWCLLWCSCFDESKPITYSMDMRIYSDKWFIIQDMSHQFCCFDSHTRKLHKFFKSIRYSVRIFHGWFFIFDYQQSCFPNMLCLRMIIIYRFDATFKGNKSDLQKVFRYKYFFKEFFSDFVDLNISSLCRQHHRHKKLKRSRGVKLSFWIRKKFFEISKYGGIFIVHIDIFNINYSGWVGIEPTSLVSETNILPLKYHPLYSTEVIPQSGRDLCITITLQSFRSICKNTRSEYNTIATIFTPRISLNVYKEHTKNINVFSNNAIILMNMKSTCRKYN